MDMYGPLACGGSAVRYTRNRCFRVLFSTKLLGPALFPPCISGGSGSEGRCCPRGLGHQRYSYWTAWPPSCPKGPRSLGPGFKVCHCHFQPTKGYMAAWNIYNMAGLDESLGPWALGQASHDSDRVGPSRSHPRPRRSAGEGADAAA